MMDDNSIKEFNWYSDIPKYIWHELVFFEMYWDYQWKWIMVSKKDDNIYLRRWYYGSCGWCDNYKALNIDTEYDDNNNELPISKNKIDEFVYAYSPEEEYKKKDITLDKLLKFVKRQQLSEDYEDLTDERCMEISKNILEKIIIYLFNPTR